MTKFSFDVRDINQSTGGYEWVVMYSADVELVPAAEGCSVEMVSLYPEDAWPEIGEDSRQLIQRAVVRALAGTGYAARLRVHRFVIHPADWKAAKVDEVTFRRFSEEMRKHMA